MTTLFTKKQVREILRLLKVQRNERPVFSFIHVDDNGYLEFTDSYQLHRSKDPIMFEAAGKYVPFETLEKWYKLAKARDTLTTDELLEMMITENEANVKYPNTARLMPTETAAVDEIGFHQGNLSMFMGIMGNEFIKMNFIGKMRGMTSENELFKGLLLPVRTYD